MKVELEGEEAIVRDVVRCGNGTHVSIPRHYKGRRVVVVILRVDEG